MDEHQERAEGLDRHWDSQMEALGELLDQLWEDEAMDIEELDGFLTAIHCCPELVPPAECLPEILGNALENEELFPNVESCKLFSSLVMHHWNAVAQALQAGDDFVPLLLEDELGNASGHYWAIGFLRGMEMRQTAWDELVDDAEKVNWLVPIFCLARENDPDPMAGSSEEPVREELQEEMILGLGEAAMSLYHYFAPHRKINASRILSPAFLPGAKRKIGRNEPCYCGSGKKYKKCCGNVTVN